MSTTYSRYFSALAKYLAGSPIDDRDFDGEYDAMVIALNRKVLCSGSAPSDPIAGQTWVDTTNKLLKMYRNNEWVSVSTVHVGTSAMATPQEGDLWYDSTNNLLKSYNGSAWATHLTPPSGSAAGDLLYFSATDVLTRLPRGTGSQLLSYNAELTAPQWVTNSQVISYTGTGAVQNIAHLLGSTPNLILFCMGEFGTYQSSYIWFNGQTNILPTNASNAGTGFSANATTLSILDSDTINVSGRAYRCFLCR